MDKKTNESKLSILNNGAVQIFFVGLLIVAAFSIGSLSTKVKMLEGGTKTPSVQGTADTNQQQAAPKVTLDSVKSAFDKSTIKFGKSNAKVVFIEVSDPSCPYCQLAGGKNKELAAQIPQFKPVSDGGTYVPPVPEMKKLVDEGKASYALVYSPGHGNGELGMNALYCAYEQGKFWEANDLIMSNAGYELLNNTVKNDKTKSGDIVNFLSGVLDSGKLKSCIDSGKYDEKISSDPQIAQSLGVNGTPGFFVNETNFAGAYSFKDMQSAVDSALK